MPRKILACLIFIMLTLLLSHPAYPAASSSAFKLKEASLVATQDKNIGQIRGIIINLSGTSYKYVKFRLKVFDKHGNYINFIPIEIKGFKARSSVSFCEFVSTFYPENSVFVLTVKEGY